MDTEIISEREACTRNIIARSAHLDDDVSAVAKLLEEPKEIVVAPLVANITIETTKAGPILIHMIKKILEAHGAEVHVNDAISNCNITKPAEEITLKGLRINFVRSVWIKDRREP